jgi:hypothetical protein
MTDDEKRLMIERVSKGEKKNFSYLKDGIAGI